MTDDLVIVLSDIGRREDGALEPADSGGSGAGMTFGREGNHVLINGRKPPHLVARAGVPQRWRIINAAKSRYFKLDLGEGHIFRKIGGDGGLLEYSVEEEFPVLGAGERADVIVTPQAEPGGEFVLRSLLHDRGYGSTELRDIEDLIAISIADMPSYEGAPLPQVRRTIKPISTDGATQLELDLTLMQDPGDLSFEYGINGVPFWRATPVLATMGETQVWTLENTTPWSHPVHLYGFFSSYSTRPGNRFGRSSVRTPSTSPSSRPFAWWCVSTNAPAHGSSTATFSTMQRAAS